MQNPRRSRTISLWFLASGVVVGLSHVLFLSKVIHNRAVEIPFILFWPNAILFGAGFAIFAHSRLRTQVALSRGESVLARWHVDASSWRAFVELSRTLDREANALTNELEIREPLPAEGIEVIVGESAADIGGSVHSLPLRGTPEITRAVLRTDLPGPAFVELELYYPGGGYGASGISQAEVRRALRFPVSRDAMIDARVVIEHWSGIHPGKADFFHGRGDGSDPEDLSRCEACGHETYKLVSHCPACGRGVQSRRWARRYGGVLAVLGLLIFGAMVVVLYNLGPKLLHPGVTIGGSRFSGNVAQAAIVLGILSSVAAFGLGSMVFGLRQVRSGRRDPRMVVGLLGLCALALLFSALLGLLGARH